MSEGFIRTVAGGLSRTRMVTNRPRDRKATLDPEGRYLMEDVLPGAWEVIWMPLRGGMQEVREVRVPDGDAEDVVLNFDYTGASVAGVVLDAEGAAARHATVDVFPGRRAVVAGEDGRFVALGLAPGAYQLRARLRGQRSRLVDVELREYGESASVQLTLLDDAPSDELEIRIAGAEGGFCFVALDSGFSQVVRIDRGTARQELSPPLPERVKVACRADGRFILGGWQDLERALERGVDLDGRESTSTIVLVGEPPGPAIEIEGPGGWNLGELQLWFGGARTFRVGEAIPNLPVGTYTLRWGDRSRTVRTERRRVVEVEIDG